MRQRGWGWRAGRRAWIAAGLLACRLGSAGGAPVDPVPEFDAARLPPLSSPAAQAALEARYAGRAADAESLLEAAARGRPADPLLALARLQCGWWTILAGEDADGQVERRMRADFSAFARAQEEHLVTHPDDPIAAFALGEAHCTLGRLDGLQGHAWGALRHHQRGIPLLERVRANRPAAPEPRASLGVFRYYTARLPRSLRWLARIARLHGDRAAGLADLRAAAAAPGVQQFAAAFFLTEILAHSEDENIEALELARREQARYPLHLGFCVELADVLVGLERPDLALEALAALDSSAASTRCQVQVVAARVELAAGRPAAAMRRLASIDPARSLAVGWVVPWSEVIAGTSLGALGRRAEAETRLERAAALPDVAGSRGAAREARERLDDPLWPVCVEAESLLAWDGDPAAAQALLLAARATHPDARPGPEFLYWLGVAALRAGDARAAAGHFAAAGERADGTEAWLLVRPAIRRLQALQWCGDVEAAREVARRIEPHLGRWGTNRQLAWLVHDLTAPAGTPLRMGGMEEPPGEVRSLRLKDTGFTTVAVRLCSTPEPARWPMALRAGYWQARLPLRAASAPYRFEVDAAGSLLDPAAAGVLDLEGSLWSLPAGAAAAAIQTHGPRSGFACLSTPGSVIWAQESRSRGSD